MIHYIVTNYFIDRGPTPRNGKRYEIDAKDIDSLRRRLIKDYLLVSKETFHVYRLENGPHGVRTVPVGDIRRIGHSPYPGYQDEYRWRDARGEYAVSPRTGALLRRRCE